MGSKKNPRVSLDKTDFKILEIVRRDARASLASISRRLKLSKSAIKYRLDNLVRRGAIKSFFAVVDSRLYGFNLSVVFDITIEPKAIEEVASQLADYREVVRVYELTTSPQLHVHVLFKDHEEMQEFMRTKLYKISGIKEINTGIIIKRYKTDLTLQI
jgi:DNA-binding Lrp family transcriptional regulator